MHHDTSPVTMDVEVQRRDGEKVKVPSVLHDLVRGAEGNGLRLAATDNHTQALEVVAQLDREAKLASAQLFGDGQMQAESEGATLDENTSAQANIEGGEADRKLATQSLNYSAVSSATGTLEDDPSFSAIAPALHDSARAIGRTPAALPGGAAPPPQDIDESSLEASSMEESMAGVDALLERSRFSPQKKGKVLQETPAPAAHSS